VIRPSRYIVPTREQRLNSGTSDENRIASTAERRDHISFLIARAAEGEDAAFSELYALTNRKMRKTACAVYPRRAEVEDILQDAYFKIWRNAPNFNPDRSSPISWIARHSSMVRRREPANLQQRFGDGAQPPAN
jgi:RNA polymerase sigma-70 factor (ECF subfamily)